MTAATRAGGGYRHGTASGYAAKCRCDACKQAYREYLRQRRRDPAKRERDRELQRIRDTARYEADREAQREKSRRYYQEHKAEIAERRRKRRQG